MCSERALKIAEEITRTVPEVVKVKRTSLKYRNPHDAPDSDEKEVLLFYSEKVKTGEKAPPYIVRPLNEGEGVFRFYKPIFVRKVCLKCHGDGNDVPPDVERVLRKLYPDDRARGYREGDFRGVVSVTVKLSR